MNKGYLSNPNENSQIFSQKIISYDEIVARSKQLGVEFGNGDPYNRLRYYTKIGLLPNAVRKSFNGAPPTGAYPESVIGTLVEIDRKLKTGQSIQAVLREKVSGIDYSNNNVEVGQSVPTSQTDNFPTPVTLLPVFKTAPKPPQLNLPSEPVINVAPAVVTPIGGKKSSVWVNLSLVLFIMLIVPSTVFLIGTHKESFGLRQKATIAIQPDQPVAAGKVLASNINPFLNVNVESEFKSLLRADKGIAFSSGNFTSLFTSATLTTDRTITLPNQSGTLCLNSGNCSGAGGGITASSAGTSGTIALFTGSQTLANSILTQNNSLITINGGLSLTTLASSTSTSLCLNGNQIASCIVTAGPGDISAVGDVLTGAAFTNGGSGNSLYFHSGFQGQLTATSLTADRTYYLPNVSGTLSVQGVSTFTPGSVIFADAAGLLSEDNLNFFYDSSTKQLGLGTNTPNAALDVSTTQDRGNLINVGAPSLVTLGGELNGISVDFANFDPIGTYNRNGINISSITGGVLGDTGFKIGSGYDFGFDVSSKSRITYDLRQNTSDSAFTITNLASTPDSAGTNIHNLLDIAPVLFTPGGGATSYLNGIKIEDVVQNNNIFQAGLRIGTGWKNAIVINQDPLNPNTITTLTAPGDSVIKIGGNYQKNTDGVSLAGLNFNPRMYINATPSGLFGDLFVDIAPTYVLNQPNVGIGSNNVGVFTFGNFEVPATGAGGTHDVFAYVSYTSGVDFNNLDASSTLNVTDVTHYQVNGSVPFLGIGIGANVNVTNVMGLTIADQIPAGGSLTNQYGVKIDNLTGGSSKNYGIYLSGANTADLYAKPGKSNDSSVDLIRLENTDTTFTGNYLDINGVSATDGVFNYVLFSINGTSTTSGTPSLDKTAEAATLAGTPFNAAASADDSLSFGVTSSTFSRLYLDLSGTASNPTSVSWQYCSANTVIITACDNWSNLTGVSDGTSSLTQDGLVTWTDPGGAWIKSSEAGSPTARYFVRVFVNSVTGGPATVYSATIAATTSGNYVKVSYGTSSLLTLNNLGALTLSPTYINTTPVTITAASSNTSSISGISISGITGGAGAETALNVGAGWDAILTGGTLSPTTGSSSATAISAINGSSTGTGSQTTFSSTLGVANAGTTQNGLLITPSASASAGNINGINVANLTTPGGSTTNEVGVNVGTGWDYGIKSSSPVRFDSSGTLSIQLVGTLPTPDPLLDTTEVICRRSTDNLLSACASTGGVANSAFVHLAPSAPGDPTTALYDIDTSTRKSIYIDKTGASGDLINICTGASCATPAFVVDFNGAITTVGSITSSGNLTLGANGTIGTSGGNLSLTNDTINYGAATGAKTFNIGNTASDLTLTVQNPDGTGKANLTVENNVTAQGDLDVNGGNINFGAATSIGDGTQALTINSTGTITISDTTLLLSDASDKTIQVCNSALGIGCALKLTNPGGDGVNLNIVDGDLSFGNIASGNYAFLFANPTGARLLALPDRSGTFVVDIGTQNTYVQGNADGFQINGGAVPNNRTLVVQSGNVTLTGSGTSTLSLPNGTTTIASGSITLAGSTVLTLAGSSTLNQDLQTTDSPSFLNLTLTGNLSVQGNNTLGNAAADTITLTGSLNSDVNFLDTATGTAYNLNGSDASTNGNAGGSLTLRAGNGLTSGSGGNLILNSGTSPSGTNGDTILQTGGTERLRIVNDGSFLFEKGANDVTLKVTAPTLISQTINIPQITAATDKNDDLCLRLLGNCAGTGTGVTTSGGSAGQVAYFDGPQDIKSDAYFTWAGSTLAIGGKIQVTPSAAEGLTINQYGTVAGQTGELRLQEGGATPTNYTGFKAPDSMASNLLYTLPSSLTDTYILQTNGSGVLSWVSPTGGGIGAGDITAVGDVTSGPAFDGTAGNTLQFEGTTPDGNEISLTGADATADRTITLPDLNGTMVLLQPNQGAGSVAQSASGSETLIFLDETGASSPNLIELRSGGNQKFIVGNSGDITPGSTTTGTSTTVDASDSGSGTTLVVANTASLDVGNLINVNGDWTRITANAGGAPGNLTISPAITRVSGETVDEYRTPYLGNPTFIQNRFDTGYFLNGIITGSASTTYADQNINVTLGTLNINTTNNQAITTGTGLLTVGGNQTFSGTTARTITGPATGGLTVTVATGPITVSTTGSGTLALSSAGALNFTGAAPSTWDIGNNLLSVQTTGNGAITTGTGLFTLGGNLTFSGTSGRTITGPTTGGLTITDDTGQLTLSTTGASGTRTLTLSSAGALNLTGSAASTWANSGGALIIQSTSQNMTLQTITSGILAVTSAGALNFTGAAASSWDIGNNLLSLQTASNGAITTGTGLFTLGGNLTFSGTTLRTITGPTTGGLTINDTTGNLTLSTTTSGTLALSSAGILNLTGNGASSWQNSGGALIIQTTSQNLTLQTVTSGTLALTSAAVLNITGASASTWSLGTGNTLTLTSQNFRVSSGGSITLTTANSIDTIGATGSLTFGGANTSSVNIGSNAISLGLGNGGSTKTITIGSSNAADTINIGFSGGGSADTISLGNNVTGTSITTYSSNFLANSLATTDTAVTFDVTNLTTGTGILISDATSSVSNTTGGSLFKILYGDDLLQTYYPVGTISTNLADITGYMYHSSAVSGTTNLTGNMLHIRRLLTNDGDPYNITGAVASFSNTMNSGVTTGITDTSNILSLDQSLSVATGAVLKITNSGTGDAIEAHGNILIGKQTDNSGTISRVSQSSAGTIKASGTASIDGVTASVVYDGNLYVGTSKANAAEVYRYDGGTTWTLISNATPGTIKSAGTANIDGITSMTVYNGQLYIGTNEANNAEVYRYDSGSVWVNINTTAGRFGTTTAIDKVTAMTIYNGNLYIGTTESNAAEVYRYNGSTGTSVFTAINTTAGTFNTTASVDGVASMAVYNNKLYIGTNEANVAQVLSYDGNTGAAVFTRLNTTAGTFNTTANIDQAAALAVYNGALYVGTNEANAAEVYRYDGTTTGAAVFTATNTTAGTFITTASVDGVASMSVYNGNLYIGTTESNAAQVVRYDNGVGAAVYTLVSNAAGTISSGTQASVDTAQTMQIFNGSLYIGTNESTKAEVHAYTAVEGQSFAIKFNASSDNGGNSEQTLLTSYGTISFLAEQQALNNTGNSGMGSFLFSNAITTANGAYDVAEDYPTRDDSLQPGDIVSIDPNESNFVTRTSTTYDDTILGVYSGKPGLHLSQKDTSISGGRAIAVALVGRVPVKVSSENGLIQPGDALTSSSRPGVAMKATLAGTIIGKALESYTETDSTKVGQVSVAVKNSYWAPPLTTQIANSSLTLGNLTINNLTIADTLVISDKITLDKNGRLSVNGEIAVVGRINLTGDITITGKVDADVVAANEFKIKTKANNPSATAGTATLLSGTDELVINTTKVDDTTLVFVTPTKTTNQQLAVVEKIAGTSFKVKLSSPAIADITFNWIIVNQQISQGTN